MPVYDRIRKETISNWTELERKSGQKVRKLWSRKELTTPCVPFRANDFSLFLPLLPTFLLPGVFNHDVMILLGGALFLTVPVR